MVNVRRDLEDYLGFNLPDETWAYLERKGYIEDVVVADTSIADLAGEAMEVLEAAGQVKRAKPSQVRSRGIPEVTRFSVLSDLIAIEAREEADVVRFRETYLPQGSMSLEESVTWVRERASEQGTHTKWIRLPLPEGTTIATKEGGIELQPALTVEALAPPFGLSTELLEYAGTNGWVQRVAVKFDSALGYLKNLSASLSKKYGWQEHQAATFVLTDLIPEISQIRLTTRANLVAPVLARIDMSIDPSLTPAQVSRVYAEARRDVVGTRYRNLSQKHLKLALFAGQRPQNESWSASMRRWNEQNPTYKYSKVSNFARDCRQALERLVRPKFEIPGFTKRSRRPRK